MEVEERSGGRSGRKWRRQKGKQHPGGVSAYRVPLIVEEIISAAYKFFLAKNEKWWFHATLLTNILNEIF